MIRRQPRSTLERSSAASDVYKRQIHPVAAPKAPDGIVLRTRQRGVQVGQSLLVRPGEVAVGAFRMRQHHRLEAECAAERLGPGAVVTPQQRPRTRPQGTAGPGAQGRAMQPSAQMRRAGKEVRESHLEAELLHEFRRHGAQSVAYNSIVAAGSDGFLGKPFALREVEARLKALVARRRGRVVNRKMVHGAIAFDPGNMAVSVDGRPVHLSRKCLRLLEMMMSAPNRVYSRAELEQELWGDEHPQSDSLRSHMHLLRRALTDASGLSPIETVPGVGHPFSAPGAPCPRRRGMPTSRRMIIRMS